jgi:hypothetical protein
MASENVVKQELASAFPGIDKAGPVFDAFGIIGAYLSKGDIETELKTLEDSMMEVARRNSPRDMSPNRADAIEFFNRKAAILPTSSRVAPTRIFYRVLCCGLKMLAHSTHTILKLCAKL